MNIDIKYILERAYSLQERINNYLLEANKINDKAINDSERDLNLDDLPYGEEVIRLKDCPKELESIISIIEDDIQNENEYYEIENRIQEVEDTLNDCTSIIEENEFED